MEKRRVGISNVVLILAILSLVVFSTALEKRQGIVTEDSRGIIHVTNDGKTFSLGMTMEQLQELKKYPNFFRKEDVKPYLNQSTAEKRLLSSDHNILIWYIPVDIETINISIKKGYTKETYKTEIPRIEWEDVKKIIFN